MSELFIHLPTTATTPPEFRKKTKAKPTKGFLQNTGLPTVIFDAILVGFALYFAEISVDVAAKRRLKAAKTHVAGDVKKIPKEFFNIPLVRIYSSQWSSSLSASALVR